MPLPTFKKHVVKQLDISKNDLTKKTSAIYEKISCTRL